ncbi:DgyrCDS6660 [Dimorphilus gyrociliatus]|uniref:DgyrCDS6660 n=1 Tax=Dimorphilus gyrociliatus TaxID=2664684 RepID=A0A7I8VQZ5_9ANNE|nr:DgyrCDS6660 [Dimorphilus gyrociliatus]
MAPKKPTSAVKKVGEKKQPPKAVKSKDKKPAPKKDLKKKGGVVKAKAKKAQKAQLKGVFAKRQRKIRTSVHFRRPKTLSLTRRPRCPKRSTPRSNKLDQFTIIKFPLTTESAMKKIEDNNTLVFIVDKKSDKKKVRMAVKKLYSIEVEKVNTLIRPDGEKKAFVKLKSDYDALDVANKIGII